MSFLSQGKPRGCHRSQCPSCSLFTSHSHFLTPRSPLTLCPALQRPTRSPLLTKQNFCFCVTAKATLCLPVLGISSPLALLASMGLLLDPPTGGWSSAGWELAELYKTSHGHGESLNLGAQRQGLSDLMRRRWSSPG